MLFFSIKGIGQNTTTSGILETINTSGNTATGSTGSVSYSIGQVFYIYNSSESVYNEAQGVQHEEISAMDAALIEPEVGIFVFPNPTTDFVTVKINGMELENGEGYYQVFDIQGRILKQNAIKQSETQISLSNLTPSIYIIRVYGENEVLKTFKIIKN